MPRTATIPRPPPSPAAAVEMTPEKIGRALQAFFRIMEAWGVTNDQARILLGRPSRATFFLWKRGNVKGAPYDTSPRPLGNGWQESSLLVIRSGSGSHLLV